MISASTLLLGALTAAAPHDITPAQLAIQPKPLEPISGAYDWKMQQMRTAGTLNLAQTQTAICDTVTGTTNHNGQTDTVPDCHFD